MCWYLFGQSEDAAAIITAAATTNEAFHSKQALLLSVIGCLNRMVEECSWGFFRVTLSIFKMTSARR